MGDEVMKKAILILLLAILIHCATAQDILNPECYYNTKGGVNGLSVADVNGDGKSEIIAGSYDGFIYLLNESCGKIWDYYGRCAIYSVAGIDLNNDGKAEVLAGNCQHIIVVDGNGNDLWKYRMGYTVSRITSGDIKNNGIKEVIASSETQTGSSSTFEAISPEGDTVCGKTFKGVAIHGLAAVDLNGDGSDEILTGTTSVAAYDGRCESLWSTKIQGDVESISYADINNDGRIEILAGARPALYALDASGNILWTFNTSSTVEDSYAYDINADGKKEVLVASDKLYVLNNEGSLLWSYSTGSKIHKVTAYDINADGTTEIILGGDKIYLLNQDGVLLWDYRTYRDVTGLQIDAGKEVRLIASSLDRNVYVFNALQKEQATTTTTLPPTTTTMPEETTTSTTILDTTTSAPQTTTTAVASQTGGNTSQVFLIGIVLVLVLAAIYFISNRIRGIK